MKTRKTLYADEGKVLTNGTVYGAIVYLAEGESAESYNEISIQEFQKQINDKYGVSEQ